MYGIGCLEEFTVPSFIIALKMEAAAALRMSVLTAGYMALHPILQS
jgi:hypothetical protein